MPGVTAYALPLTGGGVCIGLSSPVLPPNPVALGAACGQAGRAAINNKLRLIRLSMVLLWHDDCVARHKLDVLFRVLAVDNGFVVENDPGSLSVGTRAEDVD